MERWNVDRDTLIPTPRPSTAGPGSAGFGWRALLFLFGTAALGCATATPINTGTGRSVFLIECPGAANSMSACVKKANELCPAGYSVSGSSESPQGVGSVFVNPALGTATAIQGVERRLVVECRS